MIALLQFTDEEIAIVSDWVAEDPKKRRAVESKAMLISTIDGEDPQYPVAFAYKSNGSTTLPGCRYIVKLENEFLPVDLGCYSLENALDLVAGLAELFGKIQSNEVPE